MSASSKKNAKRKEKREAQAEFVMNERREMIQKHYTTLVEEIKDWSTKMTQQINQHADEQIQALTVNRDHRLELLNQKYAKRLEFIRQCGKDADAAVFNDILKEIESVKIQMASLHRTRKKLDWLAVNLDDDCSLNTSEEKVALLDKTSPRRPNDSQSINETMTQTITTTAATPSAKPSSKTSEHLKPKSGRTTNPQSPIPPDINGELLDPNCPICYMVFFPTMKLSVRNRHIQSHYTND